MIKPIFSDLNHIDLPFITGDGIGPEISMATKKVLEAAVTKVHGDSKSLSFIDVVAGEAAFKATGEWLPQSTLSIIKEKKIALKGPLMTPVGNGQRSINVQLRKELDLYACVRPVQHFPNVPYPVKRALLDIVIFRENTEDVYRGIEYEAGSKEALKLIQFLKDEFGADLPLIDSTSVGIKPISKEGSQRIVRSAIQHAIDNNRKRVSLIHKGNIMKYTEGMFRSEGYDIAETEFKDHIFSMRIYEAIKKDQGESKARSILEQAEKDNKIIVNDVIADAGLMHLTMNPTCFDVLVLTNLNGDYYSDASAGIVGGLGVAPGANINPESGCGVFEATHGTAPDIAGKDLANPTSLILSACMMLDFIGWKKVSQVIGYNLRQCFEEGILTSDLAPKGVSPVACSSFSSSLVKKISYS
ncbi:NADP-dependent isocitrate dehydrogenase [bacterium]|jgi:isocitrate dehydrogenase|nr:NADP-dependent isocitrate dehydrogenase [bacterium]